MFLLCYSLLYYVSLLCSRNNDQKRVYRLKQCVTFIQYFLNQYFTVKMNINL